jgi:hypothetical protein
VQRALELVAVGLQGKARQWTDGGRSDVEKIGRSAENTGKTRTQKNNTKQI